MDGRMRIRSRGMLLEGAPAWTEAAVQVGILCLPGFPVGGPRPLPPQDPAAPARSPSHDPKRSRSWFQSLTPRPLYRSFRAYYSQLMNQLTSVFAKWYL
jgi:hypothetical protein